MRRLVVALAMMACALLPATAGAVTFTSDATVTNKDYGTEQVVVIGPAKVTFDNVHWGAFNANGATYEGRLSVIRGGTAIVKNSKFGPGGCSDGIQASGGGGAWGTAIVSNTEFVGLRQGSCGPHVDAIQLYGGNLTMTSSYVHDVSTGVMSYDSNGTMPVIKNNVFVGDEYAVVFLGGGLSNSQITHNVAVGRPMQLDAGHQNTPPRSNVIRDNIASINVVGGSGNQIDHNLSPSQATFVGGTGRCAYATKTPKGTASDGTDIGLNDCAGPPPPPPDRDGDGVPDASDACPDQPGTQANGCPPPDPDPTPTCDQACVDQYEATIAARDATIQDMTAEISDLTDLAASRLAMIEDRNATIASLRDVLAQIHTLSAP